MNSQTRGDVVRGPQDIGTERTGQWVLYLTATNDIISGDIRNGSTLTTKTDGIVRRGIGFNREGTQYVTAEQIAGVWYAAEWNYPAQTLIRRTNITAMGAGFVTYCKYSPNNRYIMVGHNGGTLLVDGKTFTAVSYANPVTGQPVKDYQMTSSIYAMYAMGDTAFNMTQVNQGSAMPYIGSLAWTRYDAAAWNWDVTEETASPHIIIAGVRDGVIHVTPFKLGDFDYHESGQWDLVVPNPVLQILYSEVDTTSGAPKESRFGRSFALVFADRYEIYNLLTGEFLQTFTSAPHSTISGGLWKEAQGLYL